MTSADLKAKIAKVTATRKNRLDMADEILENPLLFSQLLRLVFEGDRKISTKAAWVFEFVCFQRIALLIPHLDYFTQNLKNLSEDSGIRPVAKICEYLAKMYTEGDNQTTEYRLSATHSECLIAASFDWLIGPYRTAVKVYAMSTLYFLGKESNWVHSELALLLEKEIAKESTGFKARGKKILALINKK